MPTAAQVQDNVNRRLAGGQAFSTIVQKDAIARTKPLEAALEKLKGRFAADVADTGQERRRLQGGLSSTIAQKFQRIGGNQQSQFGGNLQQLMRKAKARQGITNRGEQAITNQQFKDRVGIARAGVSRRGQNLEAIGASGRAQQGLDASLRSSRDQSNAAIMGAVGSVAGGLASGIKNGLFSKGPDINPFSNQSVDTGTAGADFMNSGQPFDFSLDPANIGNSTGNQVFG